MNPAQSQPRRSLPRRRKATSDGFGKARGISRRKRARIAAERFNCRGLATALSVHLMRPDALAVAAIDAGNLLPVAEVMRRKYPQAQIIIAADNDHHQNGEANTGREAAEKAALSVAGWVALPPTDYKADWNDHHQQNGLKAATAAFSDSLYQIQGKP